MQRIEDSQKTEAQAQAQASSQFKGIVAGGFLGIAGGMFLSVALIPVLPAAAAVLIMMGIAVGGVVLGCGAGFGISKLIDKLKTIPFFKEYGQSLGIGAVIGGGVVATLGFIALMATAFFMPHLVIAGMSVALVGLAAIFIASLVLGVPMGALIGAGIQKLKSCFGAEPDDTAKTELVSVLENEAKSRAAFTPADAYAAVGANPADQLAVTGVAGAQDVPPAYVVPSLTPVYPAYVPTKATEPTRADLIAMNEAALGLSPSGSV